MTKKEDDYVFVSGSDGKTFKVKRSEKDEFIKNYRNKYIQGED